MSRLAPLRAVAAVSLALWLPAPASADDGPDRAPVLHLVDGGYAAGELGVAPEAGLIRWRGAAFADPIDFPTSALDSIRWPLPAAPPEPQGDFGVELTAGDMLFGTLAGLDDEALTLDTTRFGRLRIDRARLRTLHRRRGASDLVYFGPIGLDGWKDAASSSEKVPAWQDQAGQPSTSKSGAALHADLGLPARAAIEFELSWQRRPNFVLALGTDADEDSRRRAFRFEVWGDQLVAVRESRRQGDLAAIEKIADGPGHLHLRAYIDQELGRFLVETTDGRRVADLVLDDDDETPVRGGVHLANVRGDIRLERLVVRRWDGELPPEVPAGKAGLVRGDGGVATGVASSYDAESDAFTMVDDGRETIIPADQVALITFEPGADVQPRQVGLAYQDGTRLSGALRGADGEALAVEVPGVEGAIRAPVEGLRSLAALERGASPAGASDDAPTGLLELADTRLRGRLVDADARPEATCLAWRPALATSASPLKPGVSGKIVYKEEPAQPEVRPAAAERRELVLQGFVAGRVAGMQAGGARPEPRPERNRPLLLYLRTGDIVPAEVTGIDDGGVTFTSPISDRTRIAHERIKAATLASNFVPPNLPDPKRDRLLTLPRMQQANPPTHLIRSTRGDFLRGRLVGLNDQTLRVEVRLEERQVARDVIAEIIWLHPEEAGANAEAEEEAEAEANANAGEQQTLTRVQAIRNDGVRLTFLPERVAEGALSGTSDVLGACRVPLAEVDRLLIGDAIEQELTRQEAHQWALRNAEIPRAFQDDPASASGSAGTEAALVGQPAPEFTLDLLDGIPFSVAAHRGEIIILDFWATWCGPCLQAMPQVEAVAGEFRDRGVTLIAVNLQETPEQIRPMLERHKFDVTVALDRDGVAAARYGVTAIPQTVVIDREGKVARLFIGGSPQLGDQLRAALDELLAEPKPGENAAEAQEENAAE